MIDGHGSETGSVRKASGRWFARAAAALLAAAPLALAAQEGAREGKALGFTGSEWLSATNDPNVHARVLEFVRTARDIEAPIDGDGNTPMHYAAPVDARILEAIVARGVRCDARNTHGATPLHFAAAQIHGGYIGPGPRAVHILLSCGAPLGARDSYGMTPLHAVFEGVQIGAGLKHGYPSFYVGDNPVGFGDSMERSFFGGKRGDVLQALLEAGADQDAVDKRGETPLLMAVSSAGGSSAKRMRLLLAHDADPDLGDGKGRTPLIRAILVHASEQTTIYPNDMAVSIINVLLDADADPNKADGRGDTPLLHAVNMPKVVRALMEGGADPCIANRKGKLPIEITEDSEVRSLLANARVRTVDTMVTHDGWVTLDGVTLDKAGYCTSGAAKPDAAENALGLDRGTRKRIQACLVAAGFDAGAADGLFGPRTRAAIRDWQESRDGDDATGFMTKAGLDALLVACKPGPARTADDPQSGPRPQCTGKADGEACWMEVDGRPGCYIWNPNPQPGETVSWSGACQGGKASGKGKMAWLFRGEDGALKSDSGEGELRGGRTRVGHWVISNGATWEGPYVDGKLHGLWVRRGSLGREYDCWVRGERYESANLCVGPAEGTMRAVRAVEVLSGPGEEYEQVGRLDADGKVRVTGAVGAWRRVETTDGGLLGFVPASALEEGPQWQAGTVFRDCPECPEMVVVSAGEFMMGSPPSEQDRRDDEGPLHRVRIAEPFAAGVHEVTFDEWDACVGGGGCGGYRPGDEGWGRGGRPVINVSWEDARAYVDWLSRRTGEEYRLLSEAEWEYAARAGTTTRYHWGDDIGRNRVNCVDCGSRWDGGRTAPVGSFAANAFGLHDMHGNVWEWVEDCWNRSYAGAPSDGSSWESGECGLRVLRGGSWSSNPRNLRAANRNWSGTGVRGYFVGFRVARTLAR